MPVNLDIFDTNIWYYAVNQQHQWAVEYYDEVIAGDRVAYVSRYIAAEFYRKMAQTRGSEGKDLAYNHLETLWDADAAFSVYPYVLSGYELKEIRYNPRNLLLSDVLGVDYGDAPIIADARAIAQLVSTFDPATYATHNISNYSEEYRLLKYLHEAEISEINARILTHENNFVEGDLTTFGIDNVTVETITD